MAFLAVTISASGCSVVHNGYTALTRNGTWNDTVVVLRNRSFSAKAWHRRKHNFCNEKHTQDFCNGFRAGYEAVCSGSNGCTPAFPPSEYWSWEYQSAEGQGRTAAWFAGYPHGVRAAEEEGTANWHQIQMSAGMQQKFQDAGMLIHEGTIYPIPDPSMTGMPTTDSNLGTAVAPPSTAETFSGPQPITTPTVDFPNGLPAVGNIPQW